MTSKDSERPRRQAGSPADGSCAGGSGATGASTVVVAEPVTGTVEAVECAVVVEPPRVGDVEDNALPGRPGPVEAALVVAFEMPTTDVDVEIDVRDDIVAPPTIVVEIEVVLVVDAEVVDVVVVDVVVVDVVVVEDGNTPPTIRGGPTSSKCMPSGMLQVPPHANPFRRNT